MKRYLKLFALAGLAVVVVADGAFAQDVRLRPTAAVYLEAGGTGIRAPEAVAFDGSLLVVADTGNRRLLLYDVAGEQIKSRSHIRLSQVPYPIRVAIDSKGEILALDGKSHRLARLNQEGEFLGYLDIPKAAGSVDAMPRSFAIDGNDNIYVLDAAGGRILVLSGDGVLQRQVEFAAEVGSLSDLTVGPSGSVFAVDTPGRRVFVARKGDTVLTPLTEVMQEDMNFPTSIAADADGHLYLSDQYGAGIVILGQNGSFQGRQSTRGWREGFLRYPSGLCAEGGLLIVADRGNNRVQIFTIVK